MIVAAHPDDEILGLGGSMHRLIHQLGASVHVVILGEGITSRADERDTEKWKNELSIHKRNIEEAKKAIGYHSVSVYDFPDNRFDTVALLDIIKTIEKEKAEWKPDVVFTHHGGDLNIDHQRTFEAVVTACRPMEDEVVKTIITFETPSGTEWRPSTDPKHFIPNLFISFDEDSLHAKIEAMESYTFEIRDYPHPRSPEALKIRASFWGQNIGKMFAEAFCLIRSVN
ncbi:MAG: PIG-L family deacetylase [Balneolaceae bacterium]|nr:MAG: PIG-L family deacetylase [Balneolaceae bacterium]